MNDKKVKIIKNLERNDTVTYKPYVPQYKVHGIIPGEHHSGSGVVFSNRMQIATPTPLPLDNPRVKRPLIRQEATTINSPSIKITGSVPNIGNNMDHAWSSIDGEIIDDLSGEIDSNHIMIDNNEFVSNQALGFQNGATVDDLIKKQEVKSFTLEGELQNDDNLSSILSSLEEESYLLIVSGVPVCSGPMEEIQDQARSLVFGEHEMCDGNPISIDEIFIVKRIKVKIGLFLE